MKSLALVYFQVMFTVFLSSAALTDKRYSSMNDVIRALGSLYQRRLYSVRDNAEGFSHLRNQLQSQDPGIICVPRNETVQLENQKICLDQNPFCLVLSSKIELVENLPEASEKQTRNKGMGYRFCYKDFAFTNCLSRGEQLFDFSGARVNDFCSDEEVTLSGTLKVFQKIEKETFIYVKMQKAEKEGSTWSGSYYPGKSGCGVDGEQCGLMDACDVLKRNNCTWSRNACGALPDLPCKCPLDPGTYILDGFSSYVNGAPMAKDPGNYEGVTYIISEAGLSCLRFNFTMVNEAP